MVAGTDSTEIGIFGKIQMVAGTDSTEIGIFGFRHLCSSPASFFCAPLCLRPRKSHVPGAVKALRGFILQFGR